MITPLAERAGREETRAVGRMYASPESLTTRINIHDQYGSNSLSFQRWVVSLVEWQGDERVLDVGCGVGTYVPVVAPQLNAGAYVGVDNSAELIERARSQSQDGRNVVFQVADAHCLPFPDQTFDIILANHVLYHVRVHTALREVSRLLKSNGKLLAATNSERSMPELDALHRIALKVQTPMPSAFHAFSLESGRRLLSEFFGKVDMHTYEDTLRFRDPEPVVKYYASGWVYRTPEGTHDPSLARSEVGRRCQVVAEHVTKAIAKNSVFELHKTSGLFVASLLK